MTANLYADSRRDFLNGYAKHLDGVTILHDDGLYRHIQFGRRGQCGWFELVTWPWHLSITGDLESFTFARIEDMFDFFVEGFPDAGWPINPHYWAEKIVAGGATKVFSEEKFRQVVVENFWERRDEFEGEARGLFRAIREDVLEDVYDESQAHANLRLFQHRSANRRKTFEFYDTWEWDLRDWDAHYLRACHAIVWGIQRYREEVAK